MLTSLRVIFIALAVPFVWSGCGDRSEKTPSTESSSIAADGEVTVAMAKQAADVANRIAANPATAAQVLQEASWTSAEFDALLYEIAEDPALSEAYTAARN